MKLGLIGCGKMGNALVGGMIERGAVDAEDVVVYNRTPAKAKALQHTFPGIRVADDAGAVASRSETVIIASKPVGVLPVLQKIRWCEDFSPLVISIAAGVPLAAMERAAPDLSIIRAMPNTPCLAGCGAISLCGGARVNPHQLKTATELFSSVGLVVEVAEKDLHAVIGVAGSSPAYMYTILDAMADAGVALGLARDTALRLAVQSMLGSARLVQETGEHPMQLRDAVTSPGGTTIAALNALDAHGLRAAVIAGVKSAASRSREMEEDRFPDSENEA